MPTVYVAPEGFVQDLLDELGEGCEAHDRLVLSAEPARPAAWSANVWLEPVRIPFDSVKEGARKLRDIQRNWAECVTVHPRRTASIRKLLPRVSAKPLRFPRPPPDAPLGSWTLLDENTILASAKCTSAFPNGEVRFVEDREGPPNRAYLKLWEALTRLGQRPGPGDRCLDLGASPGGWTWVLQKLGADVVAVDKAPLETALPRVNFRRQSAFALEPEPFDWLFADIACYPERLLGLVEKWLASGLCSRFVCTIKFQGKTDQVIAKRFANIQGSQLVHLHHNKHELTWMKVD